LITNTNVATELFLLRMRTYLLAEAEW